MSLDLPAGVWAPPPRFTGGFATLPQSTAVTSVTAFPRFPGPRPLLPDRADERRRGVIAPGRYERPGSPPTHDVGPQPITVGGVGVPRQRVGVPTQRPPPVLALVDVRRFAPLPRVMGQGVVQVRRGTSISS